ncbi:MAG: hypothetical protein U9N82_10615 [Thermodesulfobacteriota bacterium]|nr:hypothetical protein [Thermodesulfobacteriota bacterium]
MEKRFKDEKILEGVDEKRRDFIKKVVIGTAFAVPVINSFSMDGLKINMGMQAEAKDDFDAPAGPDMPHPVKPQPPVSPNR